MNLWKRALEQVEELIRQAVQPFYDHQYDALRRFGELEAAMQHIARMHGKDFIREHNPYSFKPKYFYRLVDLVEVKPKKKAIKHKPRVPDWN